MLVPQRQRLWQQPLCCDQDSQLWQSICWAHWWKPSPIPGGPPVRKLSQTPECSPSWHRDSTWRRGSSYHRCPSLPQRRHSSPGIAAVLQWLSQWEWVREKGCHGGMKLPTWRCGFHGNVRSNHCPKVASGLNSWKKTRFLPFSNSKLMTAWVEYYKQLECKGRKSKNTWSNRQIWPWNTEWSRAKTNRVLPREHTGHSKHPLPAMQEKTLHMDITRWSTPKSNWLYSLQPKMGKLYTVSRNKTGSWL